jgi:WD40 repeat protein
VAFSPDGSSLASGSADNTIKIWDLNNGTGTKTLSGHGASVWSVAFSPDGRSLASGSDDKTIKLWNPGFTLSPQDTDLATYLTRGWLKMDGRNITWATTTNNLYRAHNFGFLNVPDDSHIAMIQRNALLQNCSGTI